MNKALKIAILTAIKNGLLSRNEARELIKAKGFVNMDLSREEKPDPVNLILQKVPPVQKHFITIINLGNGKKP